MIESNKIPSILTEFGKKIFQDPDFRIERNDAQQIYMEADIARILRVPAVAFHTDKKGKSHLVLGTSKLEN